MYEIFTYGRFEVPPENEQAFLEAWSEFAAWTSARPGAQALRLARDTRNENQWISLGLWDDAEAVRSWKGNSEFKARLGKVVQQAAEFEPTELVVQKRVSGGNVETFTPPELEPIHAPT
jgi:heme-degrading monooxygenase HmoA